MRRREFLTLLSGAALFDPLSARAEQPSPLIGVLVPSLRRPRRGSTKHFAAD
jgi:hypothetical protein